MRGTHLQFGNGIEISLELHTKCLKMQSQTQALVYFPFSFLLLLRLWFKKKVEEKLFIT